MIGKIPDKILYVGRGVASVSFKWDDLDENSKEVKHSVRPVFAVDPTRPKTIETAKKWANSYSWDWQRNKPIEKKDLFEHECDNKPFKVQILSLETRSEGGRAYKCKFSLPNVEVPFYVDLREDVLLDVMLKCGVAKNGIPNAEFIWGRVGSQMKLIRVKSLLHSKLIESGKVADTAKLSKNDLEIGGIYRNKNGAQAIYLGTYWTFNTPLEGTYGTNIEDQVESKRYCFAKKQVWYSWSKHAWVDNKLVELKEPPALKDWGLHNIKSAYSANVIEKCGQIEIGDWIPVIVLQAVNQCIQANQYNIAHGHNLNVKCTCLQLAENMHYFPLDQEPYLCDDLECLRPIMHLNIKKK